MTEINRIEELRKSMKESESITDDDREFMQKMADRMPSLSVRHNAERPEKGGDTRLDGGYLRKFRKQ